MTLPIIYGTEFLDHNPGPLHPENAGRLKAVVSALGDLGWEDRLEWQPPSPVDETVDRAIAQIHSPHYIRQLQQMAAVGGGQLDGDTVLSAASYGVARLAVRAWLDGVDRVLIRGEPAFVLARPPGHHALRDRGMGFCLLANAAIAAHYTLAQPGVDRVAILDWDVHHGNGTQAQVYNQAFEEQVLPFLRDFDPHLLIVSAGYDANAADPLAAMALQPGDFGRFTQYCLGLTRRVLFGLEGGYDYDALGRSVIATLAACLE